MRRETKTWARRLAAAGLVVAVLAFLPYQVYIRSGLRHTIALRRDLIALQAHNQELAAENERLAREAEALRGDPAAIERVARDELGWVRAGEVVVDLSHSAAPPASSSAPTTPARAASRARNRITSASSFGVTHLETSAFGMLARLAAVSMIEGSTALTVILPLSSAASASVRRCTPALEAA